MPQTPEAQSFIDRILDFSNSPGHSVDDILQPSLNDEMELRRLFATEKTNSRLNDIHFGLIDLFDVPEDLRTIRARVVNNDDDLSAKYVMPLPEAGRRKDGEPATVPNLEEFNRNWAIFTEGSLLQLLDWNNVVAAGGAVLACLLPLPESAKVSKRATRKHYHNNVYPSSDVDLFLYGLTPEQAEVKINQIYEAVRDSIPWDCTCVRTKHTVSIHSQYPYRCVQIVLRLYHSPAEILAGFDVDAPCCAYDGARIWTNPRSTVAIMRQCNTVDMTRRSPSYEARLAKYSFRDFEVYVPGLQRANIDPTIYECAISRIQGLARLLVLEKLQDANSRDQYVANRHALRSRPAAMAPDIRRRGKSYKGDLKADIAKYGLQMNDYDVGHLQLPYGPGWNAKRIEKLIYQTDLGMNSPFNPKNRDRRLHRHPAWFGTMPECLDDLCAHCPAPVNDEEKDLQEKEDKVYIRGRVEFIVEDPGRQFMTGSFNPIDEGEWAEQAYIGDIAKLFKAIASFDRPTVLQMIRDRTADVNKRDHVGRTPLHLAVTVKASEIACDLIDNGARITARLVDGRTALHLAARLDLPIIVKKLLERSAVNVEKEQEKSRKEKASEKVDKGEENIENNESNKDDEEGGSSDDDWTSVGTKTAEINSGPSEVAVIPEDDNETPDVLDVNLADWDLSWPPLFHAVASGSLSVIDQLLTGGADVKVVTVFMETRWRKTPLNVLPLALNIEDDDKACKVIERLMRAGAVSTTANDNLMTVFQRFVMSGRAPLLSAVLRFDPNAKTAVNFPAVTFHKCAAIFPLVTAINKHSYSAIAILLAHGAKINYTEEDLFRARDAILANGNPRRLASDHLKAILMPVETAIARMNHPIINLLVSLGGDVNLEARKCDSNWGSGSGVTYLDWIRAVIEGIDQRTEALEVKRNEDFKFSSGSNEEWKRHYARVESDIQRVEAEIQKRNDESAKSNGIFVPSYGTAEFVQKQLEESLRDKKYFQDVEALLVSFGAKSKYDNTAGLIPPTQLNALRLGGRTSGSPISPKANSNYHFTRFALHGWQEQQVGEHAMASYDELFQACWDGDNIRIQQLCLPKIGSKLQVDPLQITVQMSTKYNHRVTPLDVAIHRRHWDTARLVVAIAAAQYKPDEQAGQRFEVRDIALDDDDSDDGATSEQDIGEDMTEVKFIDIATRPSSICVAVSPRRLFENCQTSWISKDETRIINGTPFNRAIVEDDFEAFVQLCDLYKVIPDDMPVNLTDIVSWIMSNDRAEMLDELIRRTGVGIEGDISADDDDEDHPDFSASGHNVYLGLTVYGRKRKDLSRKNDPNAPEMRAQDERALVTSAAWCGATEILKYLHGTRPLSAYKYFAGTNSKELRAQRFLNISDLSATLPQLLGWSPNVMNETPLTAAVLSGSLETVKLLFSLSRKSTETALHMKINFCLYSTLHVAVGSGHSSELFDYLVSLGASLTEVDHRGWNIYHIAAHNGNKWSLLHMLEHVPKDITDMLLTQQSKSGRNTPLHLAVKKNQVDAVQILAERRDSSLILRDVNGFTPLYTAVQQGSANITEILCKSSPKEILYMENSVGDTILETAVQKDMFARTSSMFFFDLHDLDIREMNFSGYASPAEKMFPKEEDIIELRTTIDGLLDTGHLKNGTKLATELLSFAEKMDAQVSKRRNAGNFGLDERQPSLSFLGNPSTETTEHYRITRLIKKFQDSAADLNIKRDLIHILDVYKSVNNQMPWTLSNIDIIVNTEGLQPEAQIADHRPKSLLFYGSSFPFGTDLS